jgi:tRNA threonylcarbamoyladenosine biosynthesis protein TsaE
LPRIDGSAPPGRELETVTRSARETQTLGQCLGALACPGDIFLLSGDYGTGKTCLTQGIAWGLGIAEYTLSPSFVLVREMAGRLPLYHADLWRLGSLAEIADLGLDEYLNGNGVVVIEWAEKGSALFPGEHLEVNLEYITDTERRIRFRARGARYQTLLEALPGSQTENR